MISHRYRCIFVHIPKCGGTSIEDVIWPGQRSEADLWMGFTSRFENRYQTGGLQHLLARHIRDAVGSEVFDAYFRFTVVRNPYDRIVSQYASMRRRPDLREFIGMDEHAEFKRYLELIAKKTHVQWMPQTAFLQDEEGNQIVSEIGRFERLADYSRELFARLGIQTVLPHANASSRQPLEAYYDDEARAMVASLYSGDLRALGYSFPS